MKILIAEDDLASRKFLSKFLSQFGDCDITVDGVEALEAFIMAHEDNQPYDLVCLDIMMPKLDGLRTLSKIREIEEKKGIYDKERVRIIMTTALNDISNVNNAFEYGCEAYAAKPIDTVKFTEVMRKLGFDI